MTRSILLNRCAFIYLIVLLFAPARPLLSVEQSPARVNIIGVKNGRPQLQLVGQAGGTYRLEATTDHKNWTVLISSNCPTGTLEFVDTAAASFECRFYRGVQETGATSASSAAVFPIEVMGDDGTTRAVTVNVPAGAAIGGSTKLWLQIHGLTYDGKVSVQVNTSAWISLSNATPSVAIAEPGKSFGGIGGAFATSKLTVDLPANTLVEGTNALRFRFNFSDGRSMGFRVLQFNFLSATGEAILDATHFNYENPNTWQPLHSSPEEIAKGQALWRTASIRAPLAAGGAGLRAKCADCHAQDGRDLKYFNYSNLSIIERAKFHGLSQQEGELIASYIRSLPGPNPGRPWNPPYQPGPGIDSKPISDWAAGAGLDWVLDRDSDTLPYIFPNGITAESVRPSGNLSARQVPVAMQLPDWNHWLPGVHPKDAWGSEVDNNNLLKMYNGEGGGSSLWNLRELLANSKTENYVNLRGLKDHWAYWQLARFNFIDSKRFPDNDPRWTRDYSKKVYATGLWQLVKMWELMQEFELEGQGQNFFGTYGESRTWFDGIPFMVSPNMLHLPVNANGINQDGKLMFDYFSTSWYQIQLILNNSNRHRYGSGPIDWPYVYGFFKDLYRDTGVPNAMQMTLWLVKGMQISENGVGPEDYRTSGWSPHQVADITRYAHFDFQGLWGDIPRATKASVIEALVRNWFNKTAQYSPLQYYADTADPIALPTYVPNGNIDGKFGDRVWYMIPRFREFGLDNQLLNEITDWAKTVWPLASWDSLKAN